MPCGSRPSIAALTRSGARKASEIVMLTLRTLQSSRVAMLAAFAVGSAMSSLSAPNTSQQVFGIGGYAEAILQRL